MNRTTKILLTISLTAFALGFTDILWGIGKPIGAICFGLFLISKLLEKEVALFDEEQRRNLAFAERYQATAQESTPPARADQGTPARLIPARSH